MSTSSHSETGGEQQSITTALSTLAKSLPARRAPSTQPRCVCGHVASTHNELGYCQAKRDRSDLKHSDSCYRNGFRDAPARENSST